MYVEYAKAGPDDILMRVTAVNRGPDAAPLDLIPQAWFRNSWAWDPGVSRPTLEAAGPNAVRLDHPQLGTYHLFADGEPELMFCDNETNVAALYGRPDGCPYPKDAFHRRVVGNEPKAVNPERRGTKLGVRHKVVVPAGGSFVARIRLTDAPPAGPFADFDALFAARLAEADEFYADVQHDIADAEARSVQRQAFAGLIWNKQYYEYDVERWVTGDPTQPAPPPTHAVRNRDWMHFAAHDVLSMPDKWEYPWFAAWDTAFHMIPFAQIDPDFAKAQLAMFNRDRYMHPSGQIPAYEWSFGDSNPPVQAGRRWRVFQIERRHKGGVGDLAFLEKSLHRLMLNFTWWVNQRDARGRNIFQGGFLGMDNIGVFNRSEPLPAGIVLSQSDGTAWMAMYALHLMRMALELALPNPVYQDAACKFFEHFLTIARAMTDMGGQGIGLWDDDDKFYYDELVAAGRADRQDEDPLGRRAGAAVRRRDAGAGTARVRAGLPQARRVAANNKPHLAALVSRWSDPGRGDMRLLSLLRGHRMKRLLKRMLDPNEFLSDYGIRSLSKAHEKEPFVLDVNGQRLTVGYLPGDSDSGMFGGNSNWRGPIWFPINYLIVESLQKFHRYYGDDFKVECPTGSGVR